MATLGYCAGNMIGPFLFFPREKPKYPVRIGPINFPRGADVCLQSGFTATASCSGLGIVLMLCLIVVIRYENSRRDRVFGVVDESILHVVKEELSTTDRTNGENSVFRYMM